MNWVVFFPVMSQCHVFSLLKESEVISVLFGLFSHVEVLPEALLAWVKSIIVFQRIEGLF